MKLITLPDNKKSHQHLTLGKEYEVESWGVNGVKITMDNGEEIIILKERFV